MLIDNKKMMLGQKRNSMVDIAQGRYVQFIDDDDHIESDMLRSVLDATDSDADVITFLVSVSVNGAEPKICRYSKDYEVDKNTASGYERLPNHICCIKRDIAVKASFPNVLYGEDSGFSKLLVTHLQTEYSIDRVLYHYDYNDDITETQIHLNASLRIRKLSPIVDVVVLSNATTPQLQVMTQNAINTCIAGANSLPVNVIVMEQQEDCVYQNALTLEASDEFHYNAFANRGARYGHAEWIMIANNDLIFHDGWLHNLLSARHPVVSPKCPGDTRQVDITENTSGFINGTHFSGWCFMIKRELWEKLGGFDTSVNFWCSDDVVVEQLKSVGVEPMLVSNSIVSHLRSVTLDSTPNKNKLTWGQIEIFNEKFEQEKFVEDPRFLEWKASNGSRCVSSQIHLS